MIENIQCAAILAGGQSSRMKREKALIEIDGQTLIARTANILRALFPQIVVVTSKPEVTAATGLEAITDQFPDCGPLGGIHAALRHFEQPTFVVACDMPFLSSEFVAKMGCSFSGDALIPRHEDGIEPLHAIYAPICLPVFEQFLTSGERIPSFKKILAQVDARFISPPEDLSFENWNEPSDVR